MRTLNVNTPGKIIISGEHSVVHGCPAIAATCSLFLHTEFIATSEKAFTISSPQYEINQKVSFSEIAEIFNKNNKNYQLFCKGELPATEILNSPIELLIHALHIINLRYKLSSGGIIIISSQIPPGAGMGSSAAAVTGVIQLLSKQFNLEVSTTELIEIVHECENLQHGKSSGLDPATIINGGMIYYRNGIFTPIELTSYPSFYLINTGEPQSSTGECVSHTRKLFNDELKQKFSDVTKTIYNNLKANSLDAVKKSVRQNHQLLVEIGVVPEKVINFAKEVEASLDGAFKISGAGSIKGDGAGIAILFSDQSPLSLCQKYGYSLVETKITRNQA